jgi:copper homeostasis protein
MAALVEACVDSVEGALAAERAGASRLELCANLGEGGTTPSAGMVRAVLQRVAVPVFAMVRPRGGDFLYTAEEIEVMLRDAESLKASGVHGIVSGALHPDGSVDDDGTSALIEASHPLPFTFHRALDVSRDLDEALGVLIALGVARVLTSGGAATAAEGMERLARLVRLAGERLIVMAGGGVRRHNAASIVAGTGAREVHLRAASRVESRMTYRAPSVRIAQPIASDELSWSGTDEGEIRAVVAALH